MLSKRLKMASSFINPNLNFADIGCDHGYLAIEAIKMGVKVVQLVDNKEGPLQIAKNNLSKFNNDVDIVYTLSDGLTNLDSRINIVAICGMGGDLIVKIVNDSIDTAKNLDYLILEANSKVNNLRKFLDNQGFSIIDEKFVIDRGKEYQILKVKYTNDSNKLSDEEIEFGPILLSKMSIDYRNYLIAKSNYLEGLLQKADAINLKNINKQLKMIKEILYETN